MTFARRQGRAALLQDIAGLARLGADLLTGGATTPHYFALQVATSLQAHKPPDLQAVGEGIKASRDQGIEGASAQNTVAAALSLAERAGSGLNP